MHRLYFAFNRWHYPQNLEQAWQSTAVHCSPFSLSIRRTAPVKSKPPDGLPPCSPVPSGGMDGLDYVENCRTDSSPKPRNVEKAEFTELKRWQHLRGFAIVSRESVE